MFRIKKYLNYLYNKESSDSKVCFIFNQLEFNKKRKVMLGFNILFIAFLILVIPPILIALNEQRKIDKGEKDDVRF